MFKIQYKIKGQGWGFVSLPRFKKQSEAEVAMRLLKDLDELRGVKLRVIEIQPKGKR